MRVKIVSAKTDDGLTNIINNEIFDRDVKDIKIIQTQDEYGIKFLTSLIIFNER